MRAIHAQGGRRSCKQQHPVPEGGRGPHEQGSAGPARISPPCVDSISSFGWRRLGLLGFASAPSAFRWQVHDWHLGIMLLSCRATTNVAQAQEDEFLDRAALHISQLSLAAGPHTLSMGLQFAASVLVVTSDRAFGSRTVSDQASPGSTPVAAAGDGTSDKPSVEQGTLKVQLRVSMLSAGVAVQEPAPMRGPHEVSTRGLLEMLVSRLWGMLAFCLYPYGVLTAASAPRSV